MHFKVSSAKRRSICPGPNVLIHWPTQNLFVTYLRVLNYHYNYTKKLTYVFYHFGSIEQVLNDFFSPNDGIFLTHWGRDKMAAISTHFDTFKRIFLKGNVRIYTKISLKSFPKRSIDKIPALFQIMAWRRPDDRLSSVAMKVSLLTHICVARSQWVKIRQH